MAHPTAACEDPRPADCVVSRFAGDPGDGMHLTGDRFTAETAAFGNDLAKTTAKIPWFNKSIPDHGPALPHPGAGKRTMSEPDALGAAAQHRGSALVETHQNCPIFNDGAFGTLKSDAAGRGFEGAPESAAPLRLVSSLSGGTHRVMRVELL